MAESGKEERGEEENGEEESGEGESGEGESGEGESGEGENREEQRQSCYLDQVSVWGGATRESTNNCPPEVVAPTGSKSVFYSSHQMMKQKFSKNHENFFIFIFI